MESLMFFEKLEEYTEKLATLNFKPLSGHGVFFQKLLLWLSLLCINAEVSEGLFWGTGIEVKLIFYNCEDSSVDYQ